MLQQDRIDEFFSVAKSLGITEIMQDDEDNKIEEVVKNTETLPSVDHDKVTNKDTDQEEFPEPHNQIEEETVEDNISSEDSHAPETIYTVSGPSKRQKHDIPILVPKYCTDCEKAFASNGSLLTHIRSFHQKIKHECDTCGYQFSDRSNMIKHKKNVHDGIKYPCNLCDYKSGQQGHLKAHIKSKH